ncbi:MAG TPA: formyltransferase family protein [Bradyrhizobium sp.]|uniref:formyltransferase family protein n=1 Tax=Bradyrhizobium sp. TaxID=376 RepID=UPI002CD82300|nr:formyltransferase family protein [Bradyrhizobium sp.]HLZ03397.1 formyltransferase family protein [Bradyrhizobium sp.]
MFDTIILLTGPTEQVPLASALRGHRPQLVIYPVTASEELAALDTDVLQRARLIAFSSPVIVPSCVLSALGYGAYNFHPGPPDYPGWAPAHFAMYDGATEFGGTMHAMTERVDAGPIVDVVQFPVPAGINVEGLEGLAYAHLAQMYWRHAGRLANEAAPLPERPITWGPRKNTRRSYQAICDISLDITKDEFERRMRVVGHNHFGMSATIHLHGVEFRAVTRTAS